MWKTQVRTGWYVPGWQCLVCLTAYGREFVFRALVLHHSAYQEYPFMLAQFSLSLCILILHDPLWVMWGTLLHVLYHSVLPEGSCYILILDSILSFPKFFWALSCLLLFSQRLVFIHWKKKSSAIKIIICYSWKTKVSRVGLMMFSYLASLWLYSTSLMESIRY